MDLKHIVSFSGGKDSTAMLLMMIERDMQIDEIIFCDTEKEFPEMYKHIKKVEAYICRPIITLKPEPKHKFDYLMFNHIKTKGKNKGKKGYGWAYSNCRWCSQNVKRTTMDNYFKALNKDYIEYIGIAFDELERVKTNIPIKKYPLIEWKITEGEALKYCYDKGFDWDGLYTKFNRVSCWCCPFSNLKELRNMYVFYPELWKQLKDMDKRSCNSFRSTRSKSGIQLVSVQDLENRFDKEIKEATCKNF